MKTFVLKMTLSEAIIWLMFSTLSGTARAAAAASTEISIPPPVQGYITHKKTHTPRTLS